MSLQNSMARTLLCLFVLSFAHTMNAQYEKKYGNAGKYLNSYRCELGRLISSCYRALSMAFLYCSRPTRFLSLLLASILTL